MNFTYSIRLFGFVLIDQVLLLITNLSILLAVHKPSHQSPRQASVLKDSLPIGKEEHAWSIFVAQGY